MRRIAGVKSIDKRRMEELTRKLAKLGKCEKMEVDEESGCP